MQAGESGLQIPIDSLAGTTGYIPSLASATCTLVVTAMFRAPNGSVPSAVVPSSRLVPTGDGRTFVWNQLSSDVPYGGIYQIQLVATFTNGEIRKSTLEPFTVAPSL